MERKLAMSDLIDEKSPPSWDAMISNLEKRMERDEVGNVRFDEIKGEMQPQMRVFKTHEFDEAMNIIKYFWAIPIRKLIILFRITDRMSIHGHWITNAIKRMPKWSGCICDKCFGRKID